MKIVRLSRPVLFDHAVRFPAEGAIAVTDDVAGQLREDAALLGDPEEIADEVEAFEQPAAQRRRRSAE